MDAETVQHNVLESTFSMPESGNLLDNDMFAIILGFGIWMLFMSILVMSYIVVKIGEKKGFINE